MNARKHYYAHSVGIILFLITISLLSTFKNYHFGYSDHLEQLPMVYRSLDPLFLQNDFFVNVSEDFGPRYYWVKLISLLSEVFGVQTTYLSITLLVNTMLCFTTYYASLSIFSKKEASLLSVSLLFAIEFPSLSSIRYMETWILVPSPFALTLCCLAFVFGLKNRPILLAVAAGIASVFHGVLGAVLGVILLAPFLWTYLKLSIKKSVDSKQEKNCIILSTIVFVLLLAITLIPYLMQGFRNSLDSELFVYIVAFFRHPHHYVPSYILGRETWSSTFAFACLVITAPLLWKSCLPTSVYKRVTMQNYHYIVWINVLIAASIIFGYVFVEVLPTKTFTTLQTWRFLNFLKWFIVMYYGGLVGFWLSQQQRISIFWGILIFVHINTTLEGLALSILLAALYFTTSPKRYIVRHIVLVFALLTSCVPLMLLKGNIYELFTMPHYHFLQFISFSILMMTITSRKYRVLMGGILSFGVLVIGVSYIFPTPQIVQKIRPIFSVQHYPINSEKMEIIQALQQKTPKEAVILTPPYWGEVRLLAPRAIVIDMKAFPFQDHAITEWYERVTNVYQLEKDIDFTKVRGFGATLNLAQRNYRKIADDHIMHMHKLYDFDYAVLHMETESSFPIVHDSDNYKVIAISFP